MPPRDPYSTTPEPRTAVQGPMAPPRADAPGPMLLLVLMHRVL
jgi:hypothetical protein